MTEPAPVELRAAPVQLFAPVLVRIVLGALGVGTALGGAEVRWSSFLIGLMWLVLGFLAGRTALRTLDEVILTIGLDGITAGDGRPVQSWHGVALVWVGYVPRVAPFRRLRSPRITIFTTAGINFARRADMDVRPSASFTLPTAIPATDLGAAVRRFTTVPVVDGDQTSRRDAARSLLAPGRP